MGNCRALNPRKIPRTQADVDKAYKDGQNAGIQVMLTLAAYALKDKCEADNDLLERFSHAVTDVCDSMNRRYVSYADIVRDLKDSYGWEVELYLKKPITPKEKGAHCA